MKKYPFYIFLMVSLLASCSEDHSDYISPDNGKEVKFNAGVSNNGRNSRTVYGDETADGTSVVVNWLDGDKVTVYAPDCSVKQADYSVSASKSGGQNYADDLVKTGSAGIQWGKSGASDFYAIYPAVDGAFSTSDGHVTVNTQISATQYNKFEFDSTNGVWVGKPYTDSQDNATMSDALMYAYTPNAKSTDNKGEVDLKFIPFSTVLKFNLQGWNVANVITGDVSSDAIVYVNKITLRAPSSNANIAGDCSFTFTDGVPTAEGGNTNEIVIYPDYLPLSDDQGIEFSVFTIPQSYTMSAASPWTVMIETSNYGTYNYAITPTVDAELLEGQIHKINIPYIKINREEVELPASEWMKWIPRNVYLSELSVPGAWYATNSDYQGESTLSSLYEAGVRAFNIDCRMTASADSWEESWGLYSLKNDPNYLLQCAGSETLKGGNVFGLAGVTDVADGLTVESQLESLSALIPDDEFIYVVLTIAEKPKDLSGVLTGNSEDFGNNVNPTNILAAIKDILVRRGQDFKVFGYRGIDADKTLNANTTVNDVLGSMVIKINVNVDQDKTDLANYSMNNVLLSEGSMASIERYISDPIVAGSFKSMNEAPMYWGSAKISGPSMMYYYHQAQLTTNSTTTESSSDTATPTLLDRMNAIDNIIDKSAEIYANNEHNALFQLGIGGYVENSGEDRSTVASILNTHVQTKITEKLEGSPSPVGLVLMNYCLDYTTLINNIIEMNTKFYLNRDAEQVEWPGENPYNPSSGTDQGDF